MAEYIEREAVRNALYEADTITMEGVKTLNQFPASDVAPVVKDLQPAVRLLHKEYEKAKKNPIVRNPLAYALYQVWKAVDDCENGR